MGFSGIQRKTRSIVYFAALILTALAIFTLFYRDHSPDRIKRIPAFAAADINNKKYDNKTILGDFTYLQFIDSEIDSDIDLFTQVLYEWFDTPLRIVGITKDIYKVKNFIHRENDRIILLKEDGRKLREAFLIDSGHHYLFDRNGLLLFKAENTLGYRNGVRYSLNKTIYNIVFDLSVFIDSGSSLADQAWLASVLGEPRGRNKYSAFFYSVCAGCNTGMIMRKFIAFYRLYGSWIDFEIILSQRYKPSDIVSMKSQLNTDIAVMIADQNLNDKWRKLVDIFREDDLTGIIVFSDEVGVIRRVFTGNESGWAQKMEAELEDSIRDGRK